MINYSAKLRQLLSVIVVAGFLVTSLFIFAADSTAAEAEVAPTGNGPGAGTVPTAPRNLEVDRGPGFNWLWWEHPTSQGSDLIKTYEIWRGETPGGEILHDWVYVGSTEHEGTYLGGWEFYNDSLDVVLETDYYYTVVAVSDAGSSPASNEVSATPSLVGEAPLAPTVTGLNGIYSADLTWNWPGVPSGSPPARFFFTYRDPVMFFFSTWEEWLRTTSASDEAGFFTSVGESYTYTVRAVNTYGQGAEGTATVLIQGTGNLPSAARNLTAWGLNNSAMLWWDRPANPSAIGFDGFEIFRATNSAGPFIKINETDVLFGYDGFYSDMEVTNGVTYWYKVRAFNTNDVGEYSNVVEVTPSEYIPPFEVSYLDAYPGNNQVLLDWGSAFDADGYDIFRSESSGTETLLTSIGASDYYFDTTALNGHTYFYYVKPKRDSTIGPASEEASATPSTGAVPAAATGVVATPDYDGAMIYVPEQTVSSMLIGYEVYRNGTTPGSWVLADTEQDFWAEYGFWWFDSGRIPDVNYQYTIKLKNLYGTGPSSDVVTSFGSPSGERPDAVQGLTATGQAGGVLLEWSAPYSGTATLLTYYIERNDTDGTWDTIGYLDRTQSSLTFVDTWAIPGVTYQYRVQVTNNYGDGDYSNVVSGTASQSTPEPSAPLGLSAQSLVGSVVLSWAPPASQGSSPITGYQIFRGTTSGGQGTTPIATVGPSEVSYTDVVAPGTYYYVVKAVNAVGASPASNEVQGTSIAAQPPEPPTNLVAAGHDGYVILAWDAPSSPGSSSVIRFDIFRGTSADSIGTTPIANVSAGTLTYNDTTVTNGQTYYYQVKAVNNEGSSPVSNTANATPIGPSPPTAPRDLVAIAHDGYVILSWDAPVSPGTSVITRYDVYRGANASSIGATPIGNVTAGILSYNDTTVTNGDTYYYVVKAVSDVGSSPASNGQTATPGRLPSAPLGLVANGGAGFILLNWTAPFDEGSPALASYDIYRGTSSGVFGSPIANVLTGMLEYNDTTAVSGTPYYYVVKAVNVVGSSPASNEASATSTPGPQAPTAPQNLVAQSGNNFVVLTWSQPANPGNPELTRYDIYRTPESAGTELIANVSAGTLSFNDTTATNGNTYEYYVIAVNTVGSSPASNHVIGAPAEPGTAPEAPTSLTAEAISGHILLSWTAPSGGGVSNYLVYRGTTAGGEGATPIATVSLGTIYQDNNVVPGTTYFYKVRANNSYGMSAFSNEASATIAVIVPSAPQNLVATPGEGKVTLTWQAPVDDGGSPINGYNVYRQLGSDSPVLLDSVGATVLTYEDTTGTAGTTYTYFVVATNINGAGQQSAQVDAAPQAPSEDGGMDTTTLLIIGAVVVVAIIAIAYFLMRRKP